MAALIRRQPSAQYHHVLNQSLAHNTGQNAQICFLFAKMLPLLSKLCSLFSVTVLS